MSIKVGINGFGVIGRRVAYAVNKQEDMELIGIGKTSPDYKAKIGIEKGFNFVTIASDLRALSAGAKATVDKMKGSSKKVKCPLCKGKKGKVEYCEVCYGQGKKLEGNGVKFVIEPYTRFKNLPGEQKTLFFCDNSGNVLEFKSFKNMEMLFSTEL